VSRDLPQHFAEEADHTIEPGLKVLLVEDDADVRAVIHTFLDTLHCAVTSCSDGEAALLVLDANAEFDLLLTDIALGAGMRGTELARQAQARKPLLKILLMSGYSAELLEADRDSPPQWELLRKPCTRAELTRAIAGSLST
jgi:CheY-like chemotaxis protein